MSFDNQRSETIDLSSTDWKPAKDVATSFISVGGAGTLKADLVGGSVGQSFTVVAGQELNISATKVYKTGTTATGLVALYNVGSGGKTGPQGPQGPTGATGATGAAGANYPSGVQTLTNASPQYTALPTDSLICADVSGGALAGAILFEAAPTTGQIRTVKNSGGDASVQPISVSSAGGALLEDPNTPQSYIATATIRVKGGSATWQFDGTRWQLIN